MFCLLLLVGPSACSGKQNQDPFRAIDAGSPDSAQCSDVVAYIDGDGDGIGSETSATVHHCTPEMPPGYAQAPGDCNDADPSLYRWAYPDADADGFGADAGRICVGASIPTQFVSIPDDCADDSELVYPGAPEQWSDGVDSNCDGKDDPADCAQQPMPCGCEDALAQPPTVAVDPKCQQADLFILKTTRCLLCGSPETVYVVVGNRGSAASPPDVPITVSVAGAQTVPVYIAAPLPPGTATAPLMVDSRAGSAQIIIGVPPGTDCDPSNDATSLTISNVECP
jgi:Putative metal-binding motif